MIKIGIDILRLGIIRDLLEDAKCPYCDLSGATMASKKDIGLGSAIEQCHWCYEKNRIIKTINNDLAK